MVSPDILGHTDREISRQRDAVAGSRAALAHSWKLIFDGYGEESTCLLYDALERSHAANARQIVLDFVPGSHLIALTDCPMAYIKMEASRLGIRGVETIIDDATEYLEDWGRDIEALERGETAPSAIAPSWR